MKMNELRPAKGAMKKRFKVGRGTSSGIGKTCGRGQKGAGARKSSGISKPFEGGQQPLVRRVPKRGFNSHFPDVQSVNLDSIEEHFTSGSVGPEELKKAGLIQHADKLVKILANGKLTKALQLKANAFSANAKAAIEAAGGKAEVI